MPKVRKKRKLARHWIVISALLALLAMGSGIWYFLRPEPPATLVFKERIPARIKRKIATMSLEDRIGQLIIYQTEPADSLPQDTLYRLVDQGRVGGLLLENLPLAQFMEATDSCRALAKIPLLIGTREKVSLHNQFSDLEDLPLPATLAAIRSDSIRRQMTRLYIEQCQRLGINFSLATTVRENLPADTLFQYDCYESDRESLLRRALDFVSRLQRNGILAFADGFEERSETEADTLALSPETLGKYKALADWRVAGLALNEEVFSGDTGRVDLEAKVTQRFLREQLDYNGLVIGTVDSTRRTDELLLAGTDIFVTRQPEAVFNQLVGAYRQGLLTETVLNEKAGRVLVAKNWVAADEQEQITQAPVATMQAFPSFQWRRQTDDSRIGKEKYPDILAFFQHAYWQLIDRNLYEEASLVVANPDSLLPLRDLFGRCFQVVHVGLDSLHTFNHSFQRFADMELQYLQPDSTAMLGPIDGLLDTTATLVVTVNNIDLLAACHEGFYRSINSWAELRPVVLVNFGSPLNLRHFTSKVALVQFFERNAMTEDLSAQLIFGAYQPRGRLPLALADDLPFDHSITFPAVRLEWAPPAEVGIDTHSLAPRIAQIVQTAIRSRATPGCQIAIAKSGRLIFSEAYGYHRYDGKRPVRTTDLYDIASATKIAATTLAVMELQEQDSLAIKDRIGVYTDCNPRSYTGGQPLYNLLTHQTMLPPNIPVLPYMYVKRTGRCGPYYCDEPVEPYTRQVAQNMYFNEEIVEKLKRVVCSFGPFPDTIAKGYSDVHFFLLQQAIERISGQGLDDYIYSHFYYPLNLRRTLYLPAEQYGFDEIVPTAVDKLWRGGLVHGYVHDEQAAILGGIAGHAGIFSTAEELSVIGQTLLNGGAYGGYRFWKPETVQFFTGSNPGLGFSRARGNVAPAASLQTYGHTGFTGTCLWVDPVHELVYVFLSNRIHPDPENDRLQALRIRERIHQVIYESMGSFVVPDWAIEQPGA